MRNALVALSAVLLSWAAPPPAMAWGFAAHQFIMRHAIDLLPPELKPFFTAHRDELVLRVTDPDLWRNVGWEDDPNHFMDFGVAEFGPYPFAALPREYGAAIEKFGMATIKKDGTLPWREAEEFGNLRRAFEGFKRQALYRSSDTVLFAAVAAHYIQDANQPFHATNNHDGQLTGQTGLHARFERDLIERFESRLVVHPAQAAPVTNPRDAAFEALLASYQLVDPLLAADRAASAGKDVYDDDYFEKFFVGARQILEQRLGDSITATVGVIVGAWEQAGKPVLTLKDVRPLQKVRKPSPQAVGMSFEAPRSR
jgi:hypothetical protein